MIYKVYLPDEVWINLFLSNCQKEHEFTVIELVCKKFHEIVQKDIFWSPSLINRLITPEDNKCKSQLIILYSNFIKFSIKNFSVNKDEPQNSLTLFEKTEAINANDIPEELTKVALDKAAKENPDLVPLLLEKGCRPDSFTLSLVAEHHAHLIPKLLEHGAKVNELTLRIVTRFAPEYQKKIIEHCKLQNISEQKIQEAITQGNREVARLGRTRARNEGL